MTINLLTTSNSSYSDLPAAQASLEQAQTAAVKRGDQFLDSFLSAQKAGQGIDATGICAGLAIYGYHLIEQHDPTQPLPTLPLTVPGAVEHFEMQLPRAVVHTLPKGVQPKTVTRGSSPENDQLIENISQTFATFIREEANVEVSHVFPGPGFKDNVKISEASPLVSSLFEDPYGQTERSSHYLFSLSKPNQLITEGHVFYTHLSQGVIIDAGFGSFIWRIEKTALAQFKPLLISYLEKNYQDWNLSVCRVRKCRPNCYSKLPIMIRAPWTQSNLVWNTARKIGLREAGLLSGATILRNPMIRFFARPIMTMIRNEGKFEKGVRDLVWMKGERNLVKIIKCYGELAVECQKFGSKVEWHGNAYPIPTLACGAWKDQTIDNWDEVFSIIDRFDPRIRGANARLQQELFRTVYKDIFDKYRAPLTPVEKKTWVKELGLSLLMELLSRRKTLSNQYPISSYVMSCIRYQSKAEEFLELLLIHGASPHGEEYHSRQAETMPLWEACEKRAVRYVELLLKYGANPNHSAFAKRPLKDALEDRTNNPEAIAQIEQMLRSNIISSI